jgi:RasGEF domain
LTTFHDFNAVFAIMSSLSSAPILRLKETWKQLPTKAQALNDKLNHAIDGSGNFRNYRELVKVDAEDGTTKFLACVPYLGMTLSDLTFIEEGNEDIIPDTDLINFHKFQMIGKAVEHIINNQQNNPVPSDVAVRPGLRTYLLDLDVYDDNMLYDASLDCEAGNRSRHNSLASSAPPKSASATEIGGEGGLRQKAFENRRKKEEAKALPGHMLGRPRSASAVQLTLPKSVQRLIELEKAKTDAEETSAQAKVESADEAL